MQKTECNDWWMKMVDKQTRKVLQRICGNRKIVLGGMTLYTINNNPDLQELISVLNAVMSGG